MTDACDSFGGRWLWCVGEEVGELLGEAVGCAAPQACRDDYGAVGATDAYEPGVFGRPAS